MAWIEVMGGMQLVDRLVSGPLMHVCTLPGATRWLGLAETVNLKAYS